MEMLWSNHDNPLMGHFGYVRTLELIQCKYYWPHMAKEIKVYMKSCTACQQAKPTHHKPYGELQLLQQPWELSGVITPCGSHADHVRIP